MPRWITAGRAATELGVARSSVTRAISAGRIRAVRSADGHHWLVDGDRIRTEWLANTDPARCALQPQPDLEQEPEPDEQPLSERDALIRLCASQVIDAWFIPQWDRKHHQLIDELADEPRTRELITDLYETVWDLTEKAIDFGMSAAI